MDNSYSWLLLLFFTCLIARKHLHRSKWFTWSTRCVLAYARARARARAHQMTHILTAHPLDATLPRAPDKRRTFLLSNSTEVRWPAVPAHKLKITFKRWPINWLLPGRSKREKKIKSFLIPKPYLRCMSVDCFPAKRSMSACGQVWYKNAKWNAGKLFCESCKLVSALSNSEIQFLNFARNRLKLFSLEVKQWPWFIFDRSWLVYRMFFFRVVRGARRRAAFAPKFSLFPFIRITILNFTIYSLAGRFDLAGSGECLRLLLAKACLKLLWQSWCPVFWFSLKIERERDPPGRTGSGNGCLIVDLCVPESFSSTMMLPVTATLCVTDNLLMIGAVWGEKRTKLVSMIRLWILVVSLVVNN